MNVLGPQSDRKASRSLPGAFASTARDASSYMPSESKAFDSENQRLRKEVKTLQTELNRCIGQLRFYQSHSNATYRPNAEDANEDVPPWALREDIMAPIFESYDRRIKELEEFIEVKKNEFSVCEGKLHEVISENEQLRRLHLEALQSSGAGGRSGDKLDPTLPMLNEIVMEMQERIDILMAENSLLVDQKHQLAQELEKHHLELASRFSELELAASSQKALRDDLSKLENQVKQVTFERDEAAKHALKFSDALSAVDANNEKLLLQLHVSENKLQDKESAFAQLQAQFDALNKEFSEESLGHTRKMKIVDDRNQELFQNLNLKTQECDELQDALRKLKREYQSTRSDAEGMIQVMSGLERQLSDYTAKEDELDKVMKDCKARMEAAIIERDQLRVKEEYYQRELQRMSNEKIDLVKESEIELEKKTALLQRLNQEQLQKVERETEKITEIVAAMRMENEALRRDRNALREQLEQISRKHKDHYELTQEAVDNLKMKLDSTEKQFQAESLRRGELQQDNFALKTVISRLQTQIEDLIDKSSSTDKSKVDAIEKLKSQNKNLELELSDHSRENIGLKDKLNMLTSEFENYKEIVERRQDEEINKLKRELEERSQKITEFSDNIMKICPESAIRQIKDRYTQELSQLRNQAAEEAMRYRDEATHYKNQYSEMMQLLTHKDAEITHLTTELLAYYETEAHK